MTDANCSPIPNWPVWRCVVAALPALLLIGCGGGSSGPGSSAAVSVSPQPAAVMTFVGAAATGAGIVNALVTFKCLGGTQGTSTTTQASSTTTDTAQYRVAMPVGAKLPCVARVIGPKGPLHAAVDKNHTTKDVNITPLSDLQLAVATGIAAGSFFDTFDDTLANKIDGVALAAAQKEVSDLFRPVANLSGMQSFVTDTLIPAVVGKQAGNQLDQFLDQINAAMTSNSKSLAQVTATMLEQKSGEAAAKLLWPGPVTAPPPAAQTITFVSPAAQTLGAATPALSASASSGLPVTFTSGSSSICMTSGTSLLLLASGTCQITASQAGNASFAAAPVVVQSFPVNAAAVITTTATETQTLSCPAGQSGLITQSRTVTTTNGVAVNGAWSTTLNTCVTPPPPRSCVSQALAWTVGANSCTATPPSTASGVAATTTDNTAPTTGSASFLCTDGNWGAPLNASCNAAPVLNALSTNQAARFLTQATFGPTGESVAALTGRPAEDWLTEQMSMPAAADYVDEMQRWFDKGSAYRPGNGGDNYTPGWLQHKYWSLAINAPDQLRRRVVHALLQIHVVSLEDSTLYDHGRSIGQYVDNLGKHAFGNYRNLLQDVALSPVMGMYLSHIRNQKANATTGRMPDENFAREVMQLFSIGLHQLNIDGTVKTGSNGKPLETYSNDDVIGLARVFTGWSWDMADGSNASTTFQWGGPGRYDTVGAARFDLKPMRVYPNFHETGAKSFLGVTIPAGTDGNASLRIALDTLFNHPNVGPFIGRQLIQRLVTSNPSPAYVQFVAQAFNNNGSGVRGDMAAVIRAVLLYPEARSEPTGQFGKLREPVLRVTQAARALQASSLTGRWMMGWDERRNLLQAPLGSPSVFNFYRPGYVPPNTQIATLNMVAPEFQIANETTVVEWVNYSWALLQWGVAWTGSGVDVPLANRNKSDVTIDFTRTTTTLGQAAVTSDAAVVDQLNLLLFAGRMSTTLRGQILNAMQSQVGWNAATRLADRQKIAAFIALTSSEYLIER